MAKHAAPEQIQPFLDSLAAALMDCLQGRTWDGKEDAVAALVAMASKCKDTVRGNTALLTKVR